MMRKTAKCQSLSVTVLQKPEKPTWQINDEVALDKGKGGV